MTATLSPKVWAYGITTVPSRRAKTLPKTILSLGIAGFGQPDLFVDGEPDPVSYRREFDLNVTAHSPKLGVVGNWITSLWSLYVRNPHADFYAIFQDDVIVSRGLKEYLESVPHTPKTYRNLYTAMDNERMIEDKPRGTWVEARCLDNNNPPTAERWQTGRGALGLVFDREGVWELLSSRSVAEKPINKHEGHQKVDGMIVHAMNRVGYREMIHAPSLVQHTGGDSTISTTPNRFPDARSFMGEEFDLMAYAKGVGV